ncbi:hypothetical protein [Clavibacter sp. VKM Ac-2542]|uniref:hypothetical protein n=1 Tax=Clavibacter sp. VKM Ac-2542 TaxID=2783811 RepID=UPI00188C2426|nr:hypothetical protein [Clavibacter sp. VKM Ac-2542]MBF4620238.1 hypothetical protein [Clavibacter sp. VKM Ac-2542]
MRLSKISATAALALAVALASAATSQAAEEPCAYRSSSSGSCAGGQIAGGGVDLKAHEAHLATAPEVGAGPSQPAPSDDGPAPAPNPLPRDYFDHCDVREPVCQSQFFHMSTTADPAQPGPQAVTLDDVAQFVPRDASIRSQPNGWAIVGAPVNLFTDAMPQVVDGVLLGRPAQVRFVPVSFTWDHGDGTSTTVVGPGASWKALGQQDFTQTDTSHVYQSVGDRQVGLTISYSPSYRFDGGAWQQIPGTLPVQVGPVAIRVLQGSTVLVGGACGERNAGPGCP